MKTKLIGTILGLSTLLLGGCGSVNLKDVQEFAQQGVSTTELYPQIVGDLYDSCRRSVEYQADARDEPIIWRIPEDEATLSSSRTTEDTQPVSNTFGKPEPQSPETCAQNFRIEVVTQENSDRVNGISKAVWLSNVLVAYFEANGKLAGANVSFSSEAKDLASAVEGLLQSSTDQKKAEIQAGGNILGFVLEIIASKIREDTLRAEITARNKDVELVINALEDTIKSYKTRLSFEERDMKSFYRESFDRYNDRRRRNEKFRNPEEVDEIYPLLEVVINTQWNQARRVIREKLELADNYIIALQSLREYHNSIGKTLERVSLDEHLSAEEIQQVNELLTKYARDLEPVVKNLEKDIKELENKN